VKPTGRRLGIVGCGAIGSLVAKLLRKKRSSFVVTALFDHHPESALRLQKTLRPRPRTCKDLQDLVGHCDWVLEAASQSAVPEVARAALTRKKPVVLMSVGGFFLHRKKLSALAARYRTKIYLPSGALCGLDGLRAARQGGGLTQVTLISTKPPRGFQGAPGLSPKQKKALATSKRPLTLYQGRIEGALRRFPANVNVAASLGLASGVPGKVQVLVQSDPAAKYNQHRVRAKGRFGELETVTRNRPSALNPKTSALAIQSALALFERLEGFVEIGN
jgi:aspartate dehydrogenase